MKEVGGLTIVQDPIEAEYDAMPQHAIATGQVDLVLPVRQMPGRIVEYVQRIAGMPDDELLEAAER